MSTQAIGSLLIEREFFFTNTVSLALKNVNYCELFSARNKNNKYLSSMT